VVIDGDRVGSAILRIWGRDRLQRAAPLPVPCPILRPIVATGCAGSHVTQRWREPDSNSRSRSSPVALGSGRVCITSPLEEEGSELMVPRVAEERCRKDKLPSRARAMVGARRPSMSARP